VSPWLAKAYIELCYQQYSALKELAIKKQASPGTSIAGKQVGEPGFFFSADKIIICDH
jgi:hypothetical protein